MRNINPQAAEAAHRALRAGQAAHPRFAATSCGQCGTDTGPGDAGFSLCRDHIARDMERAFFRTVASALQPRDVSQRHCYDADLGSFNAHPADPRTAPDEVVGDMLEQISCAEQALHMARQALEAPESRLSTVAARQHMNEARGFLAVPR